MAYKRLRGSRCLLLFVLLGLLCTHSIFCSAEAEFEGFGDDVEDSPEDVSIHSTAAPAAASVEVNDAPYSHSQWDEDEFEVSLSPSAEATASEDDEPTVQDSLPLKQDILQQPHYYWEIAVVGLLIWYAINLWLGRSKNENLAIAWAKCFTTENSILEKNFALIGPGDAANGEVLMKESQSCFKFYASGRRYCDALLATLDMRQRQDLLSLLLYLVSPKDDTISIDVYMNESSMPPFVMAVGTPKAVRNLLKDEEDLATYCKQISVPKDSLRFWPNDRLHVLTEHSSVFYDLFSDPRVEQVFADCPKYFRSLHFTSEGSTPKHKNVLKFVFTLPPAERIEEMAKLMQIVPVFIDIIGTYKMSTEMNKKALKVRADQEEKAFKSGARARQEALQQKKLERIQQERERLARMTPEARQRYEEKQQSKASKKMVKVKMLRS